MAPNIRRRRFGPRQHFRILVVSCLILAASACAEDAPTPHPPDHFTDDLGRTVALPDSVARAVTLAPNLTEIVYAAGAGAKLVGAGHPDDYPPEVASLPRFSVFPLDFEAVAALRPDLVLATNHVNSPRTAETFEALGIPLAFLSFESLQDVIRGVRTAGRLLGTAEEAEATADSLERRVARLRDRTDDLQERPSVLFLIGDDVLYSFGRESYIHELIALAGGRSVMEDVASVAPVLNDEFVLARRPDVIVGAWGEDYAPERLLALHPTWDVVPAVRSGRVYGVDPDLFLRPGPRLVDAAYALAGVLHPGLIAP